MARPIEICKQYGWKLSDKTFRDLGVSAFKGDNRLKGDLANFIALVKGKKLEENPILILEAFDRFSRQDIDESEPAILNLLSKGVDIFVAFSNKLFSKDSAKDLVSRIEILVSLKQAHDFSNNLSRRLKAANTIRKGRINDGKIMKIRHAPNYYLFNQQTGQYEQNEHSITVKRIITLYMSGVTLYGISNTLNKEHIKSFGYKMGDWSRQVIKQILTNPAIYGKYFDNNVFFSQPITDKTTFDRIQLMIKQNSGNKGKFNSDFPNIFKGLCKCPYCKESMSMGVEKYNSKTKKLRAEPYRYLRCSSVSNSKPCKNRHNMNLRTIEDEFFAIFLQQDPSELLIVKETDNEKEIVELQQQLNVIETKISKLLDLDDDMELVKTKLDEFKKQRQTIIGKLSETKGKNVQRDVQKDGISNFKQIVNLLHSDPNTNVGDSELRVALDELRLKLKDMAFRNKIKVMLPTFIKRIDFDNVNGKWSVFDLAGECIYTSLPM